MGEKKRKFKKRVSSAKVPNKPQEANVLELGFWKGKVRSTLYKSVDLVKGIKIRSTKTELRNKN